MPVFASPAYAMYCDIDNMEQVKEPQNLYHILNVRSFERESELQTNRIRITEYDFDH